MGFSLVLVLFALGALMLIISNQNRNNSDFTRTKIVVERVYIGSISVNTGSVWKSSKQTQQRALLVLSDKGKFCIKKGVSRKWKEIQRSLTKGDQLEVYYEPKDDFTNFEIIEMYNSENGTPLLTLEDRNAPTQNFIVGVSVFLILLLFVIAALYWHRKKHLSQVTRMNK